MSVASCDSHGFNLDSNKPFAVLSLVRSTSSTSIGYSDSSTHHPAAPMSWTSRLTGQKRDIGHDEVKISVDRYLALERSLEQLKSQNQSLNASNHSLNGHIAELRKQLEKARMQLKEQKEGPEELCRVLRGFERLPEDLTPVPDEAAVANVKRLVENLNKQINQTAASVTRDTIQRESASKEEREKARAHIASEMGAEFLDFLEDGAGERAALSDYLRVGLQAFLVRQCGPIVNAFDYSDATKDGQFASMYIKFLRQKDTNLLTTGRWRSIVKQSIRDVRHELDESGRPTKVMKYALPRIRSIMVVMGYSRQSAKVCLEAYEERVAHCFKAALEVKTAMDKVISPILHVPWLRHGESIYDVSEAEEVEDMNPNDMHDNPHRIMEGLRESPGSVKLGLMSYEFDPAINGVRRNVRLRLAYHLIPAAWTTRNTETRVIRNEVPEQPIARTSNSDKVSRASSNPVADDGPSLGSDPIDDDD